MFVPFPGLRIKQASLVSDDRLICLSSTPDNTARNAELCLLAWRSGKELARRKTWIAGEIHLTTDARFILVIAEIYLHVLRTDDLSTVAQGNMVRWANTPTLAGRWQGELVQSETPVAQSPEGPVGLHTGKKIFEDSVGGLFFMCYGAGPQRRILYAICHIDRADWTLSAAPIATTSGKWLWFSPSKRFALARHVRTIVYDDGIEKKTPFGLGKRSMRHRDAPADGRLRFSRALELWKTEPPELRAVLVVQMDAIQAVIDPVTRKPVPGAWVRFAQQSAERPAENVAPNWTPTKRELLEHPERQLWAMLHDRMNNLSDVAWEPDEAGFWTQFWSGSTKMVRFRRVGVDGSLSPMFAFARFRDTGKNVRQDFAGFADGLRLAIRTVVGHVYVRRAWCDDVGPFRLITESEDGFEPNAGGTVPSNPPLEQLERALGPTRAYVVAVATFSRDVVASVLTELAQQVRARFGELVWTETFNLIFEMSFVVAGTVVTEVDFFGQIRAARLPVAPELRNLLTAYLAALPSALKEDTVHEQVWGPPDIGAFGPALHALMVLDADTLDVFRDYLALRDGEHEKYSTDVIMPSFIAAHGWRTDETLRFGIYFALVREHDGTRASAGFLNEFGLLEAAEEMLSPAMFATMIDEELDGFERAFGTEDLTRRTLRCALQRSLVTCAYGEQVLQVMRAAS